MLCSGTWFLQLTNSSGCCYRHTQTGYTIVKAPPPVSPYTLLLSERIDGPANFRDKANGTLLFTLYDNVPVTTTPSAGGWIQAGLFADLTQVGYDFGCILEGEKITVNGKEVGTALANIKLSVSQSKDRLYADLTGYTSSSNIKTHTVPENLFASAINGSDTPSRKDVQDLVRNFQFQSFDGLLPSLQAYELDDSWIESPTALPRLWLFFEKDQLVAVIHSRTLDLKAFRKKPLPYGLQLSVLNA